MTDRAEIISTDPQSADYFTTVHDDGSRHHVGINDVCDVQPGITHKDAKLNRSADGNPPLNTSTDGTDHDVVPEPADGELLALSEMPLGNRLPGLRIEYAELTRSLFRA